MKLTLRHVIVLFLLLKLFSHTADLNMLLIIVILTVILLYLYHFQNLEIDFSIFSNLSDEKKYENEKNKIKSIILNDEYIIVKRSHNDFAELNVLRSSNKIKKEFEKFLKIADDAYYNKLLIKNEYTYKKIIDMLYSQKFELLNIIQSAIYDHKNEVDINKFEKSVNNVNVMLEVLINMINEKNKQYSYEKPHYKSADEYNDLLVTSYKLY